MFFTQSCHSLIMLSTRTAFSPSCLRPVANNHRTWIGHLGQGKQTVSLIQFRGFRSLFSICYHSSPSIPPPLLPNITKPFLLDFYLTQWESTTRPTPSHLCKTQGVHRKKPPFLTSFPHFLRLACLVVGKTYSTCSPKFPKWWWNMVIYHGRFRKTY